MSEQPARLRTAAVAEPVPTTLADYLRPRFGPPPLRPPLAITLDVDDTLIDTCGSLAHGVRAGCRFVAALRTRVDPTELAHAYHAAFGAIWQHPTVTGTYSLQELRREVWHTAMRAVGVTLEDNELDQLVDTCAAAQLDTIEPDAELRGLLRTLADRVPLALCSNGPRASIEEKLDRADLADLVTTVVCGPDNGLAKPDPALFHACSRTLNVDPTRCLHIGDSWEADVQGAQAAGLAPIWISPQQAPTPPTPLTIPRYPTATEAIRDLLQLLQHAPSPKPGVTPVTWQRGHCQPLNQSGTTGRAVPTSQTSERYS